MAEEDKVWYLDSLLQIGRAGPSNTSFIAPNDFVPISYICQQDSMGIKYTVETINHYMAYGKQVIEPLREDIEETYNENDRFVLFPWNWDSNGNWKDIPCFSEREWTVLQDRTHPVPRLQRPAVPSTENDTKLQAEHELEALTPRRIPVGLPPAAACP
jgi:hypothetical protein